MPSTNAAAALTATAAADENVRTTVIVVPLLSPSGSWLAAGSYDKVGCVMFLIVRLTVDIDRLSLLLLNEHVPVCPVRQLRSTPAALLNSPETVAPDTGLWF